MSVQVWARTDAIAAVLRHSNGMGFDRTTRSAVWPNDQFTQRRLNDGDVLSGPSRGYVPGGQLTIQQMTKLIPAANTTPAVAKTG